MMPFFGTNNCSFCKLVFIQKEFKIIIMYPQVMLLAYATEFCYLVITIFYCEQTVSILSGAKVETI